MTMLKAIVKDGKIEVEAPGDWPEGTEVRIEPIPASVSVGIRDEDRPDTPEGIARHLALMDRREPPDTTAEERAITPHDLHRQMLADGLLTQLPNAAEDIDDDEPIVIQGEPLSETIIRERR